MRVRDATKGSNHNDFPDNLTTRVCARDATAIKRLTIVIHFDAPRVRGCVESTTDTGKSCKVGNAKPL